MNKRRIAILLMSTSIFLTTPPIASAQNTQVPEVSCVTLKVVQAPDGSQSVITPKGDLAPLAGAGVQGNVAEIYMGSKGGFWYQDRTGQVVDLTPTVQALQARRAQAGQVPQYAPAPYYGQQTSGTAPVQPATQSRGSGLVTAAAAGAGAMAGAAMSNSYYNAPYGTPMHYGQNGRPYYYNEDHERREFDDLNQNQKAVIYNKRQLDKQNQQAAVQQVQTNSASRQQQYQASSSQNYQGGGDARFSQQHESHKRQEQWYQDQLKQSPDRFQRTESNPFTVQEGGSRRGEGGRGSREEGGRRSREGGGFDRGSREGGGGLRERGGGGLRERGGGGGLRERGGGGGRRGR